MCWFLKGFLNHTKTSHLFIRLYTPYPASLCVVVVGLKSSLMTVGVVQVQRHNSDKWIEMARAKETQQQTTAAVSTQQMTGFCLSLSYYLEVLSTVCYFFPFTYLHPLFFSCICSLVSTGTHQSPVESPPSSGAVRTRVWVPVGQWGIWMLLDCPHALDRGTYCCIQHLVSSITNQPAE